MSESEDRLLYAHDKQLEALQARQKIGACMWGRGTGKGVCIGQKDLIRVEHLPRGKCFLSSTTYKQMLSKTLAPMVRVWENAGYVRDVHFVMFKKPPDHWPKPYEPPFTYENTITWFTGYTRELLSMDRPDLARGGSYDGGDIDEAALVAKTHVSKVLIPSIRGNENIFDHWIHQHLYFWTSVPWKSTGFWIFDYEELARVKPEMYFFSEATSADNPQVITKRLLELWKSEMTPLDYMVEVMNMRIKRATNPFYPTFDDTVHLFSPEENKPGRVNPNAIIELSFDFGGWFNCCTVYQEQNNTEYMLDCFYRKEDSKLYDVVDDFCKAYKNHKFKFVRLWGEPRGHDKLPNDIKLYAQLERRFRQHGWEAVTKAHAGRTDNYIERQDLMVQVFEEKTTLLPKIRINEEKCKTVVIALQLAEFTFDNKKDKTKEKDRNHPQETATHFTDTVDYYFMQKHGHKIIKKKRGPRMIHFG